MPLHRISSAHMAAVGVSIAAHAAVAWGVASSHSVTAFAPQPDSVVTVSLVDAADLFAAPAPPPPRLEAQERQAPTPPQAKPAAVAASHAAAASLSPVAPPAPQPAQVAAVSPLPPTVAPRVVATPAPAPAEDPLVDYRRRVWTHLAKSAPAAPRGAGVAVAVFGLDESGSILFVRLGRSSGNPAFDRDCLKAIRAAGPLPKPPAGASRDDLVFELPVKPRTL
jgi:protein TonB